ncbi:MAG: zinc ribbon domain-containing protein [Oscillospiraceae bacterium]|nr:zinc ribbon domain-containing protein [Oscillospiraceae bacterium]
MEPNIALIIGGVLALIGTIVLWVVAIRKKKDGTLSPFLQKLHNYFQFKQLYIESVMKFFFTLLTLACITVGFFLLFSSVDSYYGSHSFALYGLILMIGGPIALRFVYEMTIMFILLVQNVSDIKRKLGAGISAGVTTEQPAAPAYSRPIPPSGKVCGNCGNVCSSSADFCPECGTRL